MLNRVILSLVVLCAIAASAPADEPREIELVDGSVITGEILSLGNGVYTIKSGSLGTITVTESRVRAIRQKDASSAPAAAATAAQVQSLQQRMLSDKEVLALIQSLQDNPDFKKALENPEIRHAVNAGDVAALTANPEFMKLLNNQTVREITKKVGE